jgi:hypothetical protein
MDAATACTLLRRFNAAPTNSPPPPPSPAVAATSVVRYSSLRPELKYHPFAVQIDGGYSVTAGTTNQYILRVAQIMGWD